MVTSSLHDAVLSANTGKDRELVSPMQATGDYSNLLATKGTFQAAHCIPLCD